MAKRILTVLALGSLVACTQGPTPENPVPGDDFGLAVRSNMQAQIIAKDGEVKTLAPAPGVRRSLAVDRYQTDRVETPVQVFTRDE